MKVYFFDHKSVGILTVWENPIVVPCIGDSVRLDTEDFGNEIQRYYVVTGRTVLKDSVHILCKYNNSETIIPKNEQRTN